MPRQLWPSSTWLCRHPDPGVGSAGSSALSGREMGQSRLLRSRVEEGTWYQQGIKSISLSKHAREKEPVAMLISLAGVLGLVARDTG